MTPPAPLALTAEALYSPLTPPLPTRPGERLLWGRLQGAATALAIAAAARDHPGLVLALVEDVQAAGRLSDALSFLLGVGSV